MDPASRIGPADAEVVLLNKGGRDFRLERLKRGEETPREFFYGYFDLQKAGIRAAMLSSAGAAPGALGAASDTIERGFASLTSLGVRPLSMRIEAAWLERAKVVMSFTDGFSLSMGLGFPQGRQRPVLMGGFHGISDIEGRAAAAARPLVRTLIARGLKGLDHAFFFGPADRQVAVDRYGLNPERSSVIPFGVDTEFWRPVSAEPLDAVVAVGQDPNRDYELLAAAPGRHPTWIVTRRRVPLPEGADHVKITSGDFFGADSLSDCGLRRLYCAARAVVVPLKNVYQPTGYSVTLQAMSCGKPVILSNIKGLWTRTLLKDGENCLLVPPEDGGALGAAIARVRADPIWAAKIGAAARKTALAHFGLDEIGAGTLGLARLGLSMRSIDRGMDEPWKSAAAR